MKTPSLIYETNYNRMLAMGIFTVTDHAKVSSSGFMDLSIDYLGQRSINGKMARVYALAHNYVQNGDLCPDPDMEIAVYDDMKMVEALTYQDAFGYQVVYPGDNLIIVDNKRKLNQFLGQWLRNLKSQGFKVGA